jgi:G3E family GTPase
VRPSTIPLTVVGGYLGAGKTTLVNSLLREPGGRRLGVIVNDFGSLAIDADLLAELGDDDVISLANGCVCCTVGAGLHDALADLAARDVDHVVIEVSGVADPATAAAWGTVPPFAPAGVIVLADATSVIERARDRYVGAEVTRQLGGADLVLVTKPDACDESRIAEVERWLGTVSRDAPMTRVVDGRIPADVVLGVRTGPSGHVRGALEVGHDGLYDSWSWVSDTAMPRRALDEFVGALPAGLLRVKGRVHLDDGTWIQVQTVGRRVDLSVAAPAGRSELVGIGIHRDPPAPDPFASHFG